MQDHTASSTIDSIPKWALEKVKSPREVKNFECYVPEGHSYPAWVELEKIVGTSTDHLTAGNWVEMRDALEKKNSNETYVEWGKTNPDHSEASSYQPSHSALRRDVISVRQYGEEYFLLESGNHRICHAKFAGVHSLQVQPERCFYKGGAQQ